MNWFRQVFPEFFPDKEENDIHMIPEDLHDIGQGILENQGILDDHGILEERSRTWIFIKSWAEREIAEMRKRNDKPLDAIQTASLRGQIKVMARLANLPAEIKKKELAKANSKTTHQYIDGDEYDL